MEIPRDSIWFTGTKSSIKLKLEYNHGKHQVQEAIDLTEGDFGSSIVDAKSPAEHVQNTYQGHYAAQKIRTRAEQAINIKENGMNFTALWQLPKKMIMIWFEQSPITLSQYVCWQPSFSYIVFHSLVQMQ